MNPPDATVAVVVNAIGVSDDNVELPPMVA
jgi:hypothetical protein